MQGFQWCDKESLFCTATTTNRELNSALINWATEAILTHLSLTVPSTLIISIATFDSEEITSKVCRQSELQQLLLLTSGCTDGDIHNSGGYDSSARNGCKWEEQRKKRGRNPDWLTALTLLVAYTLGGGKKMEFVSAAEREWVSVRQ